MISVREKRCHTNLHISIENRFATSYFSFSFSVDVAQVFNGNEPGGKNTAQGSHEEYNYCHNVECFFVEHISECGNVLGELRSDLFGGRIVRQHGDKRS